MYLFTDSSTGFCSGLLWKHELNLRSSHCSCSIKKMFLKFLEILQEKTCVEVSLLTRDSNTGILMWYLRNFKNTYFEEHPRTTGSETCSFTWSCLFDNLHFWLKLVHILFYINNLRFLRQFLLHYYWYCYNQQQSSGGVLQERCSYKFCKIHQKTPALKIRF